MNRKIRILVVDEDATRGATLVEVLRESGYEVVCQVDMKNYLPNVVAQTQPDVVLIDVDLPDRDTLDQFSLIQEKTPRPVVMFSKDDDATTIASAIRAGVSFYLVDGLSQSRVKPIIDVAIAHFREHQSMRVELEKAKTSLEERKFIDRAKELLMKRRKLSEPDAYGLLRKLAMDRKQRMGQVARGLLENVELLEGAQP